MKTLKKIAYNCKKATYLIEKKNLDGISIKEEIELKLHLTGCAVCRLFQQQSLFIDRAVKAHLFHGDTNIPKLDEDFKEVLNGQIRRQLEDER